MVKVSIGISVTRRLKEKLLIGLFTVLCYLNLAFRLQDYQTLKPKLEKVMTKDSKILMLGCGNSCKF